MPVEGDTQQAYGGEERNVHPFAASHGVTFVYTPYKACRQQDDVNNESGIEREAETVDKQKLEPSAYLHNARHDAVKHGCNQYHRAAKCYEASFQVGVRVLLIIIYQYNRRNTKQVQQMHADRQARQIGNQNQPTVAMRLCRTVFPFQYQPEYHGGEKAGVCVYLALDGAEPEGIAPRISQRAYQSRPHDGDKLSGGHVFFFGANQLLGKVRDAPEQEKDTRRAHQCAHDVHHACHLRRVAGELAEQVGCKHKERCARWMAYFQFISGGDKFGTVPKAGGRLDSHAIGNSRDQKSEPAHQVVNLVVLFHSKVYFYRLCIIGAKIVIFSTAQVRTQ